MCALSLASSRINGQLVALKVISMNAEEGVPFTAIREGNHFRDFCLELANHIVVYLYDKILCHY